jgi:hypothetical protein
MKKIKYCYEVLVSHKGEVDLEELGITEGEWENFSDSEKEEIVDNWLDDEKEEIMYYGEKESHIVIL